MALKIKINTKPTNINTSNKVELSPKLNKEDEMISALYKKMETISHILKRPQMYMGKMNETKEEMYVLSKDSLSIIKEEVSYVPAILKLFDEVISNALDQYIRINNYIIDQDRIRKGEIPSNIKIDMNKKYIPVSYINVNINENEIIVENNGTGFDVVLHPEHNIYIPQLLLFNPMAGTNFDDDNEKRQSTGLNGIGVTLLAIMSSQFKVETIDDHRGLKYEQTVKNNLSEINEPIITKCKSKPYTKITFNLDFKQFKINNLNDGDIIRLIKKRIYDISAISHTQYNNKLKVSINNEEIKVCNFEKYINMFIGGSKDYPRQYVKINDNLEICITCSEDGKNENVSYVNGINTYKGGTHVDMILNYIARHMLKMYTDTSKNKTPPTLSQIKDNIMLFVNIRISNPQFSGQTKEELETHSKDFGMKFELDDEIIKKLLSARMCIMENAKKLANFKAEKDQSKTDGKIKNKKIMLPKIIDALYAKDNLTKRKKCVLIVTEGDSAATSAISALSALEEEDRKYYGIMPLKGKIINLKDKQQVRFDNNSEIAGIKQLVGLRQGIDYSIESNRNELRYHRIMVLTDADSDGVHISGLIFNLFHTYWKELLKIDGFLYTVLTPNVIVTIKSNTKSNKQTNVLKKFYSLASFDKWKNSDEARNNSNWTIKYYKGLGSSNTTEVKEWFINPKTQDYSWSNHIYNTGDDDIINSIVNRNNSNVDANANIDVSLSSSKFSKIKLEDILKSKKKNKDLNVDEDEDEDEDENASDSDDESNETKSICSVASSSDHEKYVKDYIDFFQSYKSEDLSDLAIMMGFSGKLADIRKGWITTYLQRKANGTINYELNEQPKMNYFDFITHKFVEYSVDNVDRSLPNLLDGLKISQRKILYICLKFSILKEIKVAQLSGRVAEYSDYHHGEVSLAEAIICMAQNYVGSNNINLLVPEGQFGSRVKNGNDSASPRYIHTYLNNITSMIFNKEDEYLYEYMDSDGTPIEPVYYTPIIPMILVNGSVGIGSGWSTSVPCFNPRDIINNIKLYLTDKSQKLTKMIPWYRGFKGTITEIKRGEFKVTGVYNRSDDKTINITELPVGTNKCKSFSDYKEFAESLVIGNDNLSKSKDDSKSKPKAKIVKQYLEDVECLYTDITFNCKLIFPNKESLDELMSNIDKFEKDFKLTTIIKTTNMHLHNADGIITKYKSAEHILEEFADIRLKFYKERKDLMLSNIQNEIDKINEKVRFLEYQNDNIHELKVQHCTKKSLIELLEKYNFKKLGGKVQKKMYNKITGNTNANEDLNISSQDDIDKSEDINKASYNYLINMPIYSLTIDKLEQLRKELPPLLEKYNKLDSTTIQTLWFNDLTEIENELDKFDVKWGEEYNINEISKTKSKVKINKLKLKV
jgi:DNA topoisomerase-2